MSNIDLKTQAATEMRRSIVAAMEHAGMSAGEIIEILESAIAVLKSGDMR